MGTNLLYPHRTEKLPQTAEELEALKLALYEEIDKAIEQDFNTFLMGTCYGFDLMAAMRLHYRSRLIRMDRPHRITLIAVVPFEGEAKRWNGQNRELYFNTLSLCDEVITLNTHCKKGCYQERNRWLVDHSGWMICCYDGSKGGTRHTVTYEEQAGLPILNLYQA